MTAHSDLSHKESEGDGTTQLFLTIIIETTVKREPTEMPPAR